MTISAGQEAAAVTSEALRLIENTLGVHTSLGVSNISFGLPQRDNVNAAFFTMALQSGLSAAIVNPNSAAMRKAYDAYCALSGVDQRCMDYVARYLRAAFGVCAKGFWHGDELQDKRSSAA